jgi:hypothetical protein
MQLISTILLGAWLSVPIMPFVPAQTHIPKLLIILNGNNGEDVFDFDPLLSPHAYPNGIDNGVTEELLAVEESSLVSSFGFESIEYQAISVSSSRVPEDDVFDPTLSPHSYPNGIDNGAMEERRRGKLGILLIDHGSKREASNNHLHNLAKIYQHNINQDEDREEEKVVRGAHMEIAAPSILTSLRELITVDQVTRIVCVPYFLSPGRHATTDVPDLIAEAKTTLNKEGVMSVNADEVVEIIVSDALGTHTESMLNAVDKLVDLALED